MELTYISNNPDKDPNRVKAGRAVMSYLIPPVGIVTYFMIKDERPKAGRAYLGIGLASIAMWIGYSIIKKKMAKSKK